MKTTRRQVLSGLVVSVVAPWLPGCRHHNPNEIELGAYLSLSGENTEFGVDTRNGIELALDEVNQAGGLRGKKVRIYFEDDKSNATETTQKVRQLIDRYKVLAVLGEVASSRSLSGGLICQQHRIPMVTPSSTALAVTRGRNFVFRACFTDDMQGRGAASYVIRTLGKKQIAILYVAQDPYSSGLADSFEDEAKKLGASVIIKKGYPQEEKNFRTVLSQIAAVHPEVIFAPNYYNDMVPIAQQAAEVGLPGALFFGGDGWDSDSLLTGAGDLLEGAYFTNHYAPGVPWERAKHFRSAYEQRFQRAPTSLAAQGYDAAGLLFDAITRAAALTPEAIRDALSATRAYQGATGVIGIDKNNNAIKALVVVQIHNREFTYIGLAQEPS